MISSGQCLPSASQHNCRLLMPRGVLSASWPSSVDCSKRTRVAGEASVRIGSSTTLVIPVFHGDSGLFTVQEKGTAGWLLKV